MSSLITVNTLFTLADTCVPAISKAVNTATMKNGPQLSEKPPIWMVCAISRPAVENTADR